MKRLLMIVLALTFCAGAVMAAPPTYTWNQTWDFSDGQQGWVKEKGAGFWVNPATDPAGPMLPDGGLSGGMAGNLYAPDNTIYTFDVSSLGLKGKGTNARGFVLQADLYIPNLRPLADSGFGGLPGNANKSAGIQAQFTSGKAVYMEADLASGKKNWFIKDSAWSNSSYRTAADLLKQTETPDSMWWDQWITMTFDYGYTTAGKFSAWVYIPWNSINGNNAGWYLCGTGNYDTSDHVVNKIAVGGAFSWTQTQIDNVKLAYAAVPEPASFLALGTGLIGILGVIRRRK